MKIGVFYSSVRGKTEFTAKLIKDLLHENCDVHKIAEEKFEENLKKYNAFIFLIPTYGCGEPHEDWKKGIEIISRVDLKNKTVGLIGRGNQGFYAATFINGLKPVYDILIDKEVNIVGFTDITGYDFAKSTAVINDKFIGLALDEMFMLQEVKEKLKTWIYSNFGEILNEK